MNKKNFSIIALIAFIFITFFAPTAIAEEIPLLTWERGKEQNVILGAESNAFDWNIKLVNDDSIILNFKRSSISPDGFVVYSLSLPSDVGLGLYSIQTFDGQNQLSSIVAGVEVIEIQNFEITSIPFAFKSLLLYFVFFLSCLISSRNSRVIRILNSPQKNFEQELSELQKSYFTRILSRLRRESVNDFKDTSSSLVGYALRRDLEFFRLLPALVTFGLPIACFVLGFTAGLLTGTEIPNVPIIFIFILAVLGILNFLNGIYGAGGFISAQLIFGETPSLSVLLSIFSLALGWIICGICADLLALKDQERNLRSFTLTRIVSFLIPGATFIFTQNLANSFTLEVRSSQSVVYLIGIFISIAYSLKSLVYFRFNSRSIDENTFTFIRLPISARYLLAFSLVFLLMVYSWSQNWLTSLLSCVFFTLPLSLAFVNLSQPQVSLLKRIPRNPLAEASIVTGLSFAIFETIGWLPFTVDQKSTLYVTFAFLPSALHAVYLNLYDVPVRREVGAKL